MLFPSFLRAVVSRAVIKRCGAHPPRLRRNRVASLSLWIETLEDRTVPSAGSISIADATVNETTNVDAFVPANVSILRNPKGVAFGPDRNGDAVSDLYVVGSSSNNVVVYDGKTGAFVEQFVPPNSGLDRAAFLVFGPDGDLFVGSFSNSGKRDTILRVDQITKAITTFVSNNPVANGGLDNVKGMLFSPDGQFFYAASATTNQILRYDGSTGALIDVFADANSGLRNPAGLLFGPDRNSDGVSDIYVASNGTNQVLTYSGANGTPLGVFVSAGDHGLNEPHDMAFGADGNLYVVSPSVNWPTTGLNLVYRFDGTSGAFVDIVIPNGNGLVGTTAFIAFDGQGDLYIGNGNANTVVRDQAGPLVTLSAPAVSIITVDFNTSAGSASPGLDYGPASGQLRFAPGESCKRILVAPIDDVVNEPNETFTVNLTNAVGATIAHGQGVVTILDNDATKFYVVNDGPFDQTFEYSPEGNTNESYNLNNANTAPRGAASTAAGDKVWVVDANQKVYVYNPSGGLLGSWTAGGLPGNPQVEGIATNGTDIWLVDNKQDKVFKYTGAASRLSGSQNAASSFSLNSGNSNPKDIVTDGTSLWVVNDSTTDKVFKYTVAGALLGSWTIDAANSSPTGITLDPSNVSHLWIVDSGTDKVYQYDNAASRTSGSQSASTTFALAAGNTNPQGIADPPAPDTMLAPPLLGKSVAQSQPVQQEMQPVFWGLSFAGTNGDNKASPAHYHSGDELELLLPFGIDLGARAAQSDLFGKGSRPISMATARTEDLFGLDLFFASLGEDCSEI